MYSTIEKTIRKLTAPDAIGDIVSKLTEIYNLPDVPHKFNQPSACPIPPVTLRPSYDIRSAWHNVTRTA